MTREVFEHNVKASGNQEHYAACKKEKAASAFSFGCCCGQDGAWTAYINGPEGTTAFLYRSSVENRALEWLWLKLIRTKAKSVVL